MFELKKENSKIGINIPTTLDEIVKELPNILKDVKIPEHYCIIAMAMKTDLFSIALNASGNSKEQTVEVIPLFAKANESRFPIDMIIGDKVIVERASLERATHLHIPISASMKNIINFINEGSNSQLRKSIIDRTYGKENKNATMNKSIPYTTKDKIYVLEFKIIPIGDIRGAIGYDKKTNDPFKVVVD